MKRTILKQIKEIDDMALEANKLWNKLESFKRDLAKEHEISDKVLSKNGIFIFEQPGE